MGQNPRTEGEIHLEDHVQNTACPVQLRLKENTLTAWLCGEIDHHTARKIREAVDEAASRVRPERLILDFSAVQFMDSSGIGLIMGRCKLLAAWNGRVIVRHVPPKLERIVSLSGLQTLCDVEEGGPRHETDQ